MGKRVKGETGQRGNGKKNFIKLVLPLYPFTLFPFYPFSKRFASRATPRSCPRSDSSAFWSGFRHEHRDAIATKSRVQPSARTEFFSMGTVGGAVFQLGMPSSSRATGRLA